MIMLQLPEFPNGQYFEWDETPGAAQGLSWPGRGWQGYSSLGVVEGMTSEVKA